MDIPTHNVNFVEHVAPSSITWAATVPTGTSLRVETLPVGHPAHVVVPTQETYIWYVTYQNGTTLAEYDSENTVGRGFAEVEPALVKMVHLTSVQGGASHVVAIPDGATPVFFRRRKLILNPVGEEYAHAGGASCIGWKQGMQEVYLFVLDDGSTLLTSDLQAV